MKNVQTLRRFVLSSWFLAMAPAIAVVLLLPSNCTRYSLEAENAPGLHIQSMYDDLNSDSVSEFIYSSKALPYFHISVKTPGNRIYDQWNIKDSLNQLISEIFTGNFDHDKYREIYVFSHSGDSLFLNMNEMLEKSGAKKERRFITRIGFLTGHISSVLQPGGFYDSDGDGFDEVYFLISSAFTSGPRKLYSFDIVKEELRTSPPAHNIPLFLKMTDTDNDHRPEIFGRTTASGNYRSDVVFSDSSSWFMVFSDSLEFEFPPVEFPGFAGSLDISAFNRGFMLVFWCGGADTSLVSRVMLYSADGKLIKSRELQELGIRFAPCSFVFSHSKSDRFLLASNSIYELNGMLEVVRTVETPFKKYYYCTSLDIDNDGNEEIFIYSFEEDNKRLLIYSQDLRMLVDEKISLPSGEPQVSHFFSEEKEHKLYLSSAGKGMFLQMKPNKSYILGYLSYPAIYVLIVLVISLARRVNELQIVRKEELRKRLVTLQLQSIKAQLDPHFALNTLNLISTLIYNQDRLTAYDYMNKFTQLLRNMLNDGDKIFRSLGEELEFVNAYLELEKLRLGDRLNYRLILSEDVNPELEIPKLVLYTFIENAVSNGIVPVPEGGDLEICIESDSDYLRIKIEDNGAGRSNYSGLVSSTGPGQRLTRDYFEILNQINTNPARFEIKDLFDEKGHPGTRALIWVPVKNPEGYK